MYTDEDHNPLSEGEYQPESSPQRTSHDTPVHRGGTVTSALPLGGPNETPSHLSQKEYHRQLTKLSHGNRKVMSTNWEEAGKMDPISTQVASSVTGTLLQSFSQLTQLRQMLVHSAQVLNEFHVGDLDGRTLKEEVTQEWNEKISDSHAGRSSGGVDQQPIGGSENSPPRTSPMVALHKLWRDELSKVLSQATSVMETIALGVDEVVPFYNTTIRAVQPILVLRDARQRMGAELGKSFDLVQTERSEISPVVGTYKKSSHDDDDDGFPVMRTKSAKRGAHSASCTSRGGSARGDEELTPRVPASSQPSGQLQSHRRPWSSGVNQALSAKVAESIQRSTRYMGHHPTEPPRTQIKPSHDMQMLSDKRATLPKRPHTANVPGGTSGSLLGSPRLERFQPSSSQPLTPKLRPEQSRVQVIKRTTRDAKDLLTKLDVKTVVPAASSASRGAIDTKYSPPRQAAPPAAPTTTTATLAAAAAVNPPSSSSRQGQQSSVPKVPRRVNVGIGCVPNVDGTAAAYGESHLLPHNPQTLEEKAAAILMLKVVKALYRTLSNEERSLVLEHERKEQIYHHDHALLNMKLIGARQGAHRAQVLLCKVVEEETALGDATNDTDETQDSSSSKEGDKVQLVDGGATDSTAQFRARQHFATALDRVTELERQKKHIEAERGRQVKLTCIGLARNKRHLPQVM